MKNENGEQLIQCLECGKIFDRGFRVRQKFCCKKSGNLPDEGEEVLFCAKNGEIFIDELCCDGFDDDGNRMAYVGNGYDLDDIAAWMPLPKPYKE